MLPLLTLLVVACKKSPPEPAPAPEPAAAQVPAPAASGERPEPVPVAAPVPASAGERPVAEAAPTPCSTAADCPADSVCEGEGCGEGTFGICQPAGRACTRDLRPYCGCDGETFQSSGTCPLRRYAHRGPCP